MTQIELLSKIVKDPTDKVCCGKFVCIFNSFTRYILAHQPIATEGFDIILLQPNVR